MVLRLPDQVGREQHKRDRRAADEPPVEEAALRRGQQPDAGTDDPERHAVLVQQSEAGDGADGQPQPDVAGPHDTDDEPGRGRPGQQLEGLGAEEMTGREEQRPERGDEHGDGLAGPATAELPRQQRAHDDDGAAGQRGNDVEAEE